MSAVQGPKRESKEFVKKTGFFEGKPICVNPSREKLEEILATQIEKDPEYLGEDEKGNTQLQLVFWLKDVMAGDVRSVRFFLKDVVVENTVKEGEESTKKKKKQYINNVGDTTWADTEENLPDWFKKREYRLAKDGEEEMYNFMKAWLNVDLRNDSARLSFDWNKLMRGNVREIAEQIGSGYDESVVLLSMIRSVTKDGEVKEYEQVYNKEFLPGFVMKEIRLKKIDSTFIETAEKTDRKKRSKLQKFVLNVTDKQYGIKNYYTLGPLQEYDPTKNPAAGNSAKIDDDDASY
jgi:hypothetical protein